MTTAMTSATDQGSSTSSAAPSLRCQCVCRSFGGLRAVTDFSLEVNLGELVGLIGPNGAGKTTAFNVITGVYPASGGKVEMGGRRIDGLSPVQINRAGIART